MSGPLPTGVSLIADERLRQIAVEGWTSEHDAQHTHGELAIAAACYAVAGTDADVFGGPYRASWEDAWPWGAKWDKREKHSEIRRLVIAGALIAAEIDRLQNKANPRQLTPEQKAVTDIM
jgi:hypothetical protein